MIESDAGRKKGRNEKKKKRGVKERWSKRGMNDKMERENKLVKIGLVTRK